MENMSLPQEITDHIRLAAEKEGFLLVDIISKAGRTFSIEIYLDKEGGISLDECAAFNRKVSFWLEETQVAGENFVIDVCSPGLDRPLKKTPDFLWAKGRAVKVKFHEPIDGESAFIGKLTDVEGDESIVLEGEGGEVVIDRDKIAGARLWLAVSTNKKAKKPTKKSKKKKK